MSLRVFTLMNQNKLINVKTEPQFKDMTNYLGDFYQMKWKNYSKNKAKVKRKELKNSDQDIKNDKKNINKEKLRNKINDKVESSLEKHIGYKKMTQKGDMISQSKSDDSNKRSQSKSNANANKLITSETIDILPNTSK